MAAIFDEALAGLLDEAGAAIYDETGPGTVGGGPGGGGTELAYASVTRASDDTTLANDVQITNVGGILQEVTDATSIATYLFPRTYTRSDILLQTDSDALSYAQWVLYVSAAGEDRFEQLVIDPLADPVNLFPHVLGREIGDRITVWHRPANVPVPVTRDCFIRGIEHQVDAAAGTWTTTWTLQDAIRYAGFLVLDATPQGQLDLNALAYLWLRVAAHRVLVSAVNTAAVLAGRHGELKSVLNRVPYLVTVKESAPESADRDTPEQPAKHQPRPQLPDGDGPAHGTAGAAVVVTQPPAPQVVRNDARTVTARSPHGHEGI